MTLARRSLAPVLAAGAALAAATPAAALTQASYDGATVRVTGDASRNDLYVKRIDRGVEVYDSGGIVAGPGCTAPEDLGGVLCPLGGGGVEVSTGAGDDDVADASRDYLLFGDGAVRVDLGDGDDRYSGSSAGEVVAGGAGDDHIHTMYGDDTLDGGAGDDELIGYSGSDVVRGGDGDDVLKPDEFQEPSADVVDGGAGRDRLEDWWRSADLPSPPRVSYRDDGQANDGRPGERDDVTNVEDVQTGAAGTLRGTNAPNAFEIRGAAGQGGRLIGLGGADTLTGGQERDRIDGGAGGDLIRGGYGDDRLAGGPGRDVVFGDADKAYCTVVFYQVACTIPNGDDVVDVRDGARDSVDCGVGFDKVKADRRDAIAANCERVERR